MVTPVFLIRPPSQWLVQACIVKFRSSSTRRELYFPEDSRSRKPTGMRVHIFFLMGSSLSNFVIVKRASICTQTPHENITCLSAWQHNSGTHDGEAFIMSLDLFQRVISFDRKVCLLNLSALLVRIGPLWSEPQT